MNNFNSTFCNCDRTQQRLNVLCNFAFIHQTRQIDPNQFLEIAFQDPRGQRLHQSQIHRDLQHFLSTCRKGLIELPRDHGKSMQVCCRIIWELAQDPSLRVKVVCASEAIAVERGRFLRETIAQNQMVRLLFPHLRPSRPWSDTRFTIHRPANVIGPSVSAIGIGAASTGTRADLLVCDDIVDVKSMSSKSERRRIKEVFRNNLMNLLEPDGRFWGLFTPWHRDDLNQELKQNSAFELFRRAIDADCHPIWPERWSQTHLQQRLQEIGSASFARAYRLIPMSEEEVVIRPEWIGLWKEPVEIEECILAIDPALSTDPKADASALVVLARSTLNQVICLQAIAQRVATPQLMQLMEELDRLYKPNVILFEENAAFKGIKDLFVRHMRFGPKIKGICHSKDKSARIRAFSVSVENGCFRLQSKAGHVHPGQQSLWDEMTNFPHADHDDLVDAAAMGTAYLLDHPEIRIW